MEAPIIAAIINATASLIGIFKKRGTPDQPNSNGHSNTVRTKNIKDSELVQSGTRNSIRTKGDIVGSRIKQTNDKRE